MRLITCLAACTALTMPAMAFAQAAPAAGASADTSVGEVIVTARKREERLKDVPIAVTAVSADTIETQQIHTVKDIAAFAPGLTINSDAVGRAFVSIRGVGTTLIDTVQPGVGIFIDGIYQPNTSYLNSPILDVERIEVLRGPQGTLFGNNTLGGAISVVTRAPTDDVSGRFTAAYAGPDNSETVAGSVSGPIIAGVLQGRLAASYHSQDGFEDNVLAGGHANPLDQRALNGTLRWEAAPGAVFTLNAYWNKVRGGQTPYVDLTGPRDYSTDATLNLNSIAAYTYRGANLKGVFDASSLKTVITTVLAYDKKTGEAQGDGDFGPIDFLRVSNGHNSSSSVTGEVRFDTAWNDSVSSLVGVFANRATATNEFDNTIVPFAFTSHTSQSDKIQAQAIFGTIFWKLGDSIELTTGLRYDHQSVDVTGAPARYSASQIEPRITLTKHWSPRAMTYASISRGFRGGGANGAGSPNPIYRGDSVWTYEVGSKFESEDRKLSLDAAIFYNDYEHYIGQNSLAPCTCGVGFVAINLNSGKVESYGAELELRYRPTDALTLTSGISLLHARIVDGTEYTATTGMPLPSSRLLFTPDWNFFTSANYLVALSDDDSLRFDATLVGKGERVGSTLSPASVPVMEAYYLVNSTITWSHKDLDLALFATNLFDEQYAEAYLDSSLLSTAGFPPPLVHNLGIQGDGRRVGVRLAYKF